MPDRHIVAIGGWHPVEHAALTDFVLGLARRPRPRTCLIPTAVADDDRQIARFYEDFAPRAEPAVLRLFDVPRPGIREFLLDQDAIWVSGGNTANMMAIWRVQGIDSVLREAWDAGTVLAGWSAGAICWFDGGVTDSFGPELMPLDGCLGFLSGTFCPHFDGEPERRPAYQRFVGMGALPGGYAADDGVGLHFAGTDLAEIVTARPEARAFHVRRSGDGVTETPLTARHLG